MPTRVVLSALIDWVTHLASRLVPSLAVDKRDRVAYDGLTAGGSVDANTGDGYDKPLRKVFIPNTLARWPWPRRLNEYYPELKAFAWVARFKAFNCRDFSKTWLMVVLSTCLRSLSEHYACLTYPIASKGEPALEVHSTTY